MGTGTEIYAGYVEDNRMTDQAWVETTLMNYHDDLNLFRGITFQSSDPKIAEINWASIHKKQIAHHGHQLLFAKVGNSLRIPITLF